MQNVGFKRLPEFIEEDYISAIETAFTRCTYPNYFIEISRISQDDENDLGYDGVITSLVPLYVQFKRSTFHTPQFHGRTAHQRTSCGFQNRSGFFSFNLHKDRNSKRFDQHNTLYTLSQVARAVYAAPLFYKRSDLSQFKEQSRLYPWRYEDVLILDASLPGRVFAFPRMRVLFDSITIPPHAPITDRAASHEYSYTRNGDICFHSEPTPFDTPVKSLHDFILEVVQSVFDKDRHHFDDGRMVFEIIPDLYHANWRSRNFKSMLKSYLVGIDKIPSTWTGDIHEYIFRELDTADRFLLLEALLLQDFSIVQYVLRVLPGERVVAS